MNVPTFKEIREALRVPRIYELDVPVIDRQEARQKGFVRYFTGTRCKNGHISERLTTSGSCIACDRLRYELRRVSNETE